MFQKKIFIFNQAVNNFNQFQVIATCLDIYEF